MKKVFVLSCVLAAVCGAAGFSQELPTVAVATFDVAGGVTQDEAQVVTELFMTELVSKGTVNVVDRVNFDKIIAEMRFQTTDWSNPVKTVSLGQQLNAGYVIRGQLMKMGGVIYWTATMLDVNTAQVLYSAREQVKDLGEVFGKLSAFCAQMLAKIPPPNYFVGTWTSSYGDWRCIMALKKDGSIVVTRYDMGEYGRQYTDVTGSGNYSFDAESITIILSLRNGSSEAVQTTSPYTFDGSRNSFTLREGLYRGTFSNYYYTFVKVQ
jgi:TolB-like protein